MAHPPAATVAAPLEQRMPHDAFIHREGVAVPADRGENGAVAQLDAQGFEVGSLEALSRTVAHLLEARATASGGLARSYDELFALACRKVDEIAPLNVSRRAQDAANELGLGDLRTYCWFCPIMSRLRHEGRSLQHQGGKKRRMFLWEHYKPVADIQAKLLTLGSRAHAGVIREVLAETRIVWVHREEGDDLGNGSRPDPGATYRNAGVDLVFQWPDCRPVDCRRHRSR